MTTIFCIRLKEDYFCDEEVCSIFKVKSASAQTKAVAMGGTNWPVFGWKLKRDFGRRKALFQHVTPIEKVAPGRGKEIHNQRGTMLATEKVANAFKAIIEEAEKIQQASPGEDVAAAAKTIISIAKHQSDIRGAVGSGKCKSHCGCKSKE